jgi:hypothetical protein
VGSIFWKTREIGLPSYNDLSTVIGLGPTYDLEVDVLVLSADLDLVVPP